MKQAKRCSKCGQVQYLSAFYYNKTQHRHYSWCKQCFNQYKRMRYEPRAGKRKARRTCEKCKQLLSVSCFHDDTDKHAPLGAWCRDCVSAWLRKRYEGHHEARRKAKQGA